MDMFQVVILAGGLGTRMQQFGNIPKALLDLNGKPFLEHQLNLLKKNGVRKVLMCVGHLGQEIEEFAGDGSRFGLKIQYSYDGPELRGTGGAIRNALPFLDQNFFTVYGDSYLTCDFAAVQQAFVASDKNALMTVLKNEGRWDRCNVEFADGRIVNYDKINTTPSMQHIDYGLGLFKRVVFEALPSIMKVDLVRVFQHELKNNQLAAYELSERFYEVGSPEGLNDLRAFLSK